MDPESQYLRKACFLNYTISDYVLSKETAPRYHVYRRQVINVIQRREQEQKKNSSKAKLQDCCKRSTGAQCLHVVTAGYCDMKVLQVCGYFGGSSLSLLAAQALWDLCNKAIASVK